MSKRFIAKCMFLNAVEIPCREKIGNRIFEVKIGIYPLLDKEPARRLIHNRSAVAIVSKTIMSITPDFYSGF